jgi:hypothetical protein
MSLGRISLVLFLALLLPACSGGPPVPEDKFVDFYIHLQMLDARYGADVTLQKEKADSLMNACHIDKTLLDSTLSWYNKRPDRWQKFYSRVEKRLAEIKPDYVRRKSR